MQNTFKLIAILGKKNRKKYNNNNNNNKQDDDTAVMLLQFVTYEMLPNMYLKRY
jgi:hypothetical protein